MYASWCLLTRPAALVRAGTSRACRRDVDAGVATASSEAAVVAKTVLSVATNHMQADGPDGRYGSATALEGGVRPLEAARQK
mmetsp:Transcript_5420/g.16044  ORF Transcript_5420/g.16044 Transcript_5420/m.16044 type:complete len:82 (+) Transcript_5420:257-502(+)